ncbi:hypothetical protein AB0M11_09550 [Streptomyces sp. NPDC051987]|uniref:hypothetical protein n=1 Tax=Streptomyces sp. NPDC051987 TaxID=3155808 RepID=UPI0034475727
MPETSRSIRPSAGSGVSRAIPDGSSARLSTHARLPATSHPNIAVTARRLVASTRGSSHPAALDLLLTAAQVRLNQPGAGKRTVGD